MLNLSSDNYLQQIPLLVPLSILKTIVLVKDGTQFHMSLGWKMPFKTLGRQSLAQRLILHLKVDQFQLLVLLQKAGPKPISLLQELWDLMQMLTGRTSFYICHTPSKLQECWHQLLQSHLSTTSLRKND